jgi:uncharacterized membrane protein
MLRLRRVLPALAVIASPAAADPIFQGLGFPPSTGAIRVSYALGISPDGTTVVGGAGFEPVGHPYGEWLIQWSQSQGMAFVSTPWEYGGSVAAAGVSSTGTIVGCYDNYRSPGFYYGFGYPASHPTTPFAISPGGDFVVGGEWMYGSAGAFRWSAQGGYQVLGGDIDSVAKDVSADGAMIVGGQVFSTGRGFVWTPTSGLTFVGGLPGAPTPDCDLFAVAADGSLAAGWAFNASGLHQPVRWLPGRGLRIINNLAGTPEGSALDVSGNGDVIVGAGGSWTSAFQPQRAFLWDRARGTRDLKAYLLQLGSTDVASWTLQSATAISADGRTIAGTGLNPLAQKEAFIAHIPAFCYANCDLSTAAPVLTVSDFICFLNRYAAADPYANCDGSTTAPALNIADFTCFLNSFAAGCT